jgi:hypothetical protein
MSTSWQVFIYVYSAVSLALLQSIVLLTNKSVEHGDEERAERGEIIIHDVFQKRSSGCSLICFVKPKPIIKLKLNLWHAVARLPMSCREEAERKASTSWCNKLQITIASRPRLPATQRGAVTS